MWSVRQRPFYSVGGEPEDGDDASGDDVGVCVPRHGPATINMIYARWPGVFAATWRW